MQKEEIFAILGIDETKDERALKNAYRQQLMHTNPEDDPEGFKRLSHLGSGFTEQKCYMADSVQDVT